MEVKVHAGEAIGSFWKNVDFNVVDLDYLEPHLLAPDHYVREPWKVHTPDPFAYFTPSIRRQMKSLSLRDEEPYGGRFAYDIDGTLAGNWFADGTNWYQRLEQATHWEGHLTLAYDQPRDGSGGDGRSPTHPLRGLPRPRAICGRRLHQRGRHLRTLTAAVTPSRYLGGMKPPIALSRLVRSWAELTRWEKAELGRDLRRLGWTYSEIMAVIPVPKGTLAGWCRDIRLTPDQVAAIEQRVATKKDVPRDTQRKRRLEVEKIRRVARAEVPALITQPLWVAGTCLYWGEGSKTKRMLAMTNTDPATLRIFISWVRGYLMPDPEFTLSLHLHEGNDEAAAKAHWTSALHLESVRFHKTYVKPAGTGHRKNKLAQGVCRVQVRRSADAFIRTLAWIDAIEAHLTEPLHCSRVASSTGRATDS